MALNDSRILAGLLPLEELPGWQVLGTGCYSPRPPGQKLGIVITVHRGASSASPLGLALRSIHLDHGELDACLLPFDHDGAPWRVADFDFRAHTVRPGSAFATFWQRARTYIDLWLPAPEPPSL